MGMYDESWCNGCGTSVAYTDADETYCGECAAEYAESSPKKLIQLIEYMKIHLISLEQDAEQLDKDMNEIDDLDSDEYKDMEMDDIHNNGKISATHHLLSVATDIMNS
jgi:hypothetical protein